MRLENSMIKACQLALLIGITAIMTGCATPYMTDRCRDAADIFTADLGLGLGAKSRVGPIHAGALVNFSGCGLRGGEIVTSLVDVITEEESKFANLDCDVAMQWVTMGADYSTSCSTNRNKQFISIGTLDNNRELIPKLELVPDASYYTQIEVVVGVGPSLRLGFNPGELFDFILGWTTIDIYKDDLEWSKKK